MPVDLKRTVRGKSGYRIQPHSEEIEMAIIGACITEPKRAMPLAMAVITTSDYFYITASQMVWEAMNGMELDKIDIITVAERLKGRVAVQFLSKCQDAVTSVEMLQAWLDELVRHFIARQVIRASTELMQAAYDGSDGLLDEAERRIMAIRPARANLADMRVLIGQAIERIEQKLASNGISGLSTGLIDVDALTDGLHPGEMIVIAGFPSTGKSALAVNIAVTNAMNGVPSVIFTAEMTPVQLVLRSMCSEAKADFRNLDAGSLVRLANVAGKILKAPLYIQSVNKMTIQQVTSLARSLRQKHGIKLAGIDYIQLLAGEGDNREQQISSISKGIKGMAIELGIPVMALSQLTDDGKLRESRSIGQDGDSVWKLKNKGEWQPVFQTVELCVEKCRDGATGQVELLFSKRFTRFDNKSKIDEADTP